MATVLTLFMNFMEVLRMDAYTRTLRFNHNPLNLILGTERKKGLRIGYMEAGLQGFYLNSMETGVHPQKLSRLLAEEFHCTDTESVTGLFQFLINEGDRVSYQIMLPYLLSTENINEFESIIQKRFFGVERFIRQGKNLYRFVKYTEERRDPIIWINDLEKGIIGWDMGLLVSLARASQTCGHISKEQAWKYIEQAAQLCSLDLHTAEEIDKSFLLGKAMKLGSIIIVLFTPGQAQEVTIFRGLPRNPSKPGEPHKYQIPAKKPVNQKPFAYRHSSSERHIQCPRFL